MIWRVIITATEVFTIGFAAIEKCELQRYEYGGNLKNRIFIVLYHDCN